MKLIYTAIAGAFSHVTSGNFIDDGFVFRVDNEKAVFKWTIRIQSGGVARETDKLCMFHVWETVGVGVMRYEMVKYG